MGKTTPKRRFATEKARKTALARRIILLCLGLVVMIAAVVGVNHLLSSIFSIPEDDGCILPNVYIGGVNVGGMTPEAARSAVQLALSGSFATEDLVVTLPGDTLTLSPADTGARLDVQAAVDKAYEYGRTGTDAQNAQTRADAEKKEHNVALLPYLNLNLEYIYSAVDTFCNGYSMEMTQPTVTLEGKRPSYPYKPSSWDEAEKGPYVPNLSGIRHQTLVITLGTPDFVLDTQALYDYVLDSYSLHRMTVSYDAPTLTEPDAVDLDAVFAQYCEEPQDAELDNSFHVTPEVYGYGFDREQVAKLLENAQYGQSISIQLDFLTPDITEAALIGDLFKDVLAEYTATCSGNSDASRDTNLRLACEALNGYVVKAGELFSFNTAVGPCTANRGYKTAPSFPGSTATVLGGGIGQISSALYCSALLADLTVTQRYTHPYAVDYTPLGFDAAVSYGSQDLQFVNTTEDPIRLVITFSGNSVTVKLLGTAKADVNYRNALENKVLAIYTPNTISQPMSRDNQQGYTDGQVLQSGISGYDMECYLCRYDRQTGALISSTLLSTDHYSKRDSIVVRIEGDTLPSTETADGEI